MRTSLRDDALRSARLPTLLVVVSLGVMGGSIFLAMPVVAAALASSYHFSDQAIGQYSSVQLLFVSIGCLTVLLLNRVLRLRRLAMLALSVLLAADLACTQVDDYRALLVVRALGGLAGGLAISITTAVLARSARPDRNFGIFLLAQIVFCMVSTSVLPMLSVHAGAKEIFFAFATLEVITLLLIVLLLPDVSLAAGVHARRAANSTREWLLCSMTLASILAFFIAIGAFWTYVGRIGVGAGMAADAVGRALSLAGIAGAVGAFLPMWLQTRAGRAIPFLLGGGAMLAGLAGLFWMPSESGAARFWPSAGAFIFGWYLIYPYQLGVLSVVDRGGRATVLGAALTGIGLGLGPAIVAPFTTQGLMAAYAVAGVGVVAAIVLMLAVVPFMSEYEQAASLTGHDLSRPTPSLDRT